MNDSVRVPKLSWAETGHCLFPHLGWIAARAHTGRIGPVGPPRKIDKTDVFFYFFMFSGPRKKGPDRAPNGARRIFVPANPDLADILDRTDLNSKISCFFLGPQFLDFQVPRSPNS